MNAKTKRIAAVSASSLLPHACSKNHFWKNLISLDGLLPALIDKQWPFSEFLSSETLKGLKDFFIKSGMNAENIDVPETIFPFAAAKNALRLFLAMQALNSCVSFSKGQIPAERTKVMFSEIDKAPSFPDIQELFASHFQCQTMRPENTCGFSYDWFRQASEELLTGNSDLIVVVEPEANCSITSFLQRSINSISIKEGTGAICFRKLECAQISKDNILGVFSMDDSGMISIEDPASYLSDLTANDSSADLAKISSYSRLAPEKLVIAPEGTCLNLPFNNCREAKEIGSSSANLVWKKFREKLVGPSNERRFLHDLLGALMGTFVSRISLESPVEFMKVASKPVIYVANHQIGLESPLFMTLAYAATGLPIQAVAKPDHIDAWLSFLMEFAQDSLEPPTPFSLLFFDRNNPQGLIDELKNNEVKSSLLVHVDGTRSRAADVSAAKISSIFLDQAIRKNIPLVPVRFVGGLPVEPVEKPLDFPYQNGKQDYIIGTPILADQLEKLPYGQRPKMVLEKINTLGPKPGEDLPLAPDKEFVKRTAFFKESFKLPTIQAMLFSILQSIDDPCEETASLIKAVQSGKLSASAAEPGFPPVLKKFLMHLKTKFA